MKVARFIENGIIKSIRNSDKIIIIYGARQVGKTTLVKSIISKLKLKTLEINADEEKYLDILSSRDYERMKSLINGFELLFIDEAQRIPNIGINLKILYDHNPKIKIVATGSSSFELADKISEPLTGRCRLYNLYPLSFLELKKKNSEFELKRKTDECLIFGSYPEILTAISLSEKEKLLKDIERTYLYKDSLSLASVKYPLKLKDLLKLLSFQIGNEVSLTELAQRLALSRDAVENYLDLLEKSFIVFRLRGFSRNLRKEIRKMDKIYFYDLGVRNAVVDNFKPVKDRNDLGSLWENFIIAERLKYREYKNLSFSPYFWRTHTGAEIDLIEEGQGKIYGYEIKYSHKKAKKPLSFLNTYENSSFQTINQENFLRFIG